MKIEFIDKLPKKNSKIDKKCYVFYNDEKEIIVKVSNETLNEEEYSTEFVSYFKYNDEFYALEKVIEKEFRDNLSVNVSNNYFDETNIEIIRGKIVKSEVKWYIYILRCEDESLYTGISTDYEERLNKHIKGIGAKYTRIKKVKKLEAVFYTKGKGNALKIEYQIKKLNKKKKEDLIKNPLILKELFYNIRIVQIDS